jgi:hypothetical protein
MTPAELRAWNELLRAERIRREAELAAVEAAERFAAARRRARHLRLLTGSQASRPFDPATEERPLTARRR